MVRRPKLVSPPSHSWVEYLLDSPCGIDLFGCDNSTTGRQVIDDACRRGTVTCGSMSSSYRYPPAKPITDYAALHDSFLDSLLQESQQQAELRRASGDTLSSDGCDEISGLNSSMSTQSSSSWTLTAAGGSSRSLSSSESSNRKRRRPVKLNRTVARQKRDPGLVHPPIMNRANTVHLDDLPDTKPPADFIHPQCRMQKDKGKGDEIGSSVCAKGGDACLGKLRAKMRLLTEHCTPESTASASMKRRDAIVSQEYDNFVETRSILTLRMGFLSMTYGVLLRWDTGNTQQITLVVLRKNCHDSFYSSKLLSLTSSPGLAAVSPASSFGDDMETGSEISLSPPFLVPRPAVFPPSDISVAVLYATGLRKKSHWTVQLQLADQTENILLAYDPASDMMLPKLGGTLKHQFSQASENCTLEIKLLEHRLRRKNQRVLRCSMRIPTSSLDPQLSRNRVPTSMRIPCPDGATIQIEALLTSDALNWQQKEIEARRKEERKIKMPPCRNRKVEVEEEDASSPWDWLCTVC